MPNLLDAMFAPTPSWSPLPEPVRVNLTALYKERVDLRLFARPGDVTIAGGRWVKITEIRVYRVGAKGRSPVIRSDWDALAVFTDGGGIRWFGYPPRTLPNRLVHRRRPLW